ncbi:MAG TPA: hypothetical protein VFX70_20395 [Mycobacteriales bacterium]|nr:hypothetical protein [Mycobacteriales bacterium]
MDVTVAVGGEHPDDEPRSLRSWLAGDDDLSGLVKPVPDQPPQPQGTIVVRLDQRGTAAALADSLVAWIRERTHDAVYEVTRPDGVSVRLPARRVRTTNGARVRALITELCRTGEPDPGPDASGATAATGAGAGSRAGQPPAPSDQSA